MQGCRCMNRSKHLKSGMSLIEVIAAIAILAIFGSSLFLMQQYLFDRLIISQQKLIANLRIQEELVTYQTNILKEFFEPDSSVEKSLQEKIKEFANPDMTIKISTKSDLGAAADQTDKKEWFFKDFKHLHFIRAQASSPTRTSAGKDYDLARAYLFVYIPESVKNE